MKFEIKPNSTYSLASITEKKSEIVSAVITIDTHEERTIADQAVELVYTDALISGDGKHTRAEFINAVNLLGASIDVSIGNSHLSVDLRSTKQNFKKLLKLAETMFLSPTFTKSEIARIKSIVANDLHESKENTAKTSLDTLRNTLYGFNDRKYTYDVDETASVVKTVSAKHLKSFHALALSQPWTCTIAGEESAVKDFGKFVDTIKKKQSPTNESKSLHQQKPPKSAVILRDVPSRTNIDLSIGAPIPITLHHPDYIPLSFAITVLAKWGGFSGILMSTVRDKEGLTYTIYGRLEGFSGTEQGYWRIFTFFSPDKTVQGITSTFREISKFYKTGINQEQFDKFKTIINTQQALVKDSVTGLMMDLHAYHCHGFTIEEMNAHKSKVNDLTIDEVNNAIKSYLNPKDLTVCGTGPIKTVKKELEKFIKTVQ